MHGIIKAATAGCTNTSIKFIYICWTKQSQVYHHGDHFHVSGNYLCNPSLAKKSSSSFIVISAKDSYGQL